MKLRLSKQKISSTMLISMTDVIFLLLVFLLIASNFASQTGMPIRLPGSRTSERQTLQSISIKYYSNNQVFYNEMETNLTELQELLKLDFVDSAQVVRISAEKDIPLQQVIQVMDLIREAGFERIFVATDAQRN
ncbi:MAG: biopolymer transporter ExbD [Candidatus Cloacimonetes bacterium]|jgi:biopolymer transport protein ExbD|nr:biopolymer transporter ExbD [Candidatus Cloacimonadota bacterium]MDY0336300.1 biopolymer transporter ExbD [Candidatus Cloacimonadaceae bacterium]MCB5269344.1 biopolymer transporter ExbD [Candidatus Cloacimonadota bacterium]MCK9335293.1 biopolymer transporter ExbD [Candidatus Cloacimonadota bacterium]MDD2542848.1 biopolymer transporter ExbD [Candidatus Cloacimonadota bacterium]